MPIPLDYLKHIWHTDTMWSGVVIVAFSFFWRDCATPSQKFKNCTTLWETLNFGRQRYQEEMLLEQKLPGQINLKISVMPTLILFSKCVHMYVHVFTYRDKDKESGETE